MSPWQHSIQEIVSRVCRELKAGATRQAACFRASVITGTTRRLMQTEVGKTWWFFSRRCKGSRYPEGCKKKQEAAIPNLDDVVTGFNLWCCDGTASTSTLKSRLDKGNFRRVSGNFCHVSTRILYREVNAEDAHLGLLTVANITVGGLLYWLKFAYFWCYYNANFVGVCVWHVRLEVNVFLLFWSSAHCRLKNIINAIPSSVSQSKVKLLVCALDYLWFVLILIWPELLNYHIVPFVLRMWC